MEELLDIVNKDNQPTGEVKNRTEVHTNGLWHRIVQVYFFRQSGSGLEFLVQLRSKDKDVDAGKWDTRFGGHVLSGENSQETLRRELDEETGLNADKCNIIDGGWGQRRKRSGNNEFPRLFFVEFSQSPAELNFKDGEVVEAGWLKQSTIEKAIENNPKEWAVTLAEFQADCAILKKKL